MRLVENWRARLGVRTRGPRQRAREIVRFDAAEIGLPAKEKGRVTKGGQDSER